MRRLAAVLGIFLVVGACRDRPEPTPSELVVRVEAVDGAPEPGAALVFLGGGEVLEVEGEPGVLVWWNRVPGEEGVRVVAVRLSPSDPLDFRFRIAEGSEVVPQPALLSLAGVGNQRLTVGTGHRARILR
jgi:hypothetical protein